MIEQRAGGRTVPSDIVVRLARKEPVQTFYDNSCKQSDPTSGPMHHGSCRSLRCARLVGQSVPQENGQARGLRVRVRQMLCPTGCERDRCVAFRFAPGAAQIIQLRIRKKRDT